MHSTKEEEEILEIELLIEKKILIIHRFMQEEANTNPIKIILLLHSKQNKDFKRFEIQK